MGSRTEDSETKSQGSIILILTHRAIPRRGNPGVKKVWQNPLAYYLIFGVPEDVT
jgi:hypothetical protein